MLSLVMLIGILSCQQSPLDPQGSIAGGGNPVLPGASGDTTWEGGLEVNLEQFSSTEELRADRAVFAVENLGLDRVYLDTDVAYTQGGLTRSMRYDWTNQGTNAVSIGRGIRLPHAVPELWAEVVIRWSPNFTACHPLDPPCDHKTLFYQVTPDGNYRWSVHVGGGAGEGGPVSHVTMSSPRGRVEGTGAEEWELPTIARAHKSIELATANEYFDGEWHILRFHARHSTNSQTYDGWMQLWIDGVLIYDTELMREVDGAPGFSTVNGTMIRAILLGRNKDKGLDEGTESMWIGRVRAYKEDPGW